MQALFGIDSTFYRSMSRFSQIVILNLLWLVCSIPIVTIGASTTALYYVSLKIVNNNEGNIVKQFFSSFRSNFKQATIIWLILAFVGAILISNFLYYYVTGDSKSNLIQFVLIILLILYGLTLSYVFPVLAKFDNSIKGTIVFSILTSIMNIGWSLGILVITFLIWNVTIVLRGFPALFAIALASYANSFIFNRIFNRYIEKHPIDKII